MRCFRRAVIAPALAAALSFAAFADSQSSPGSIEILLQLADLLYADSNFVESMQAYDQVVSVATGPELNSARMGLVRSALRIAEYTRARVESERLVAALPRSADAQALHGDAMWAAGLFEEAERAYADALAMDPTAPRARHGIAKSLAARNRLEEALNEAFAALRESPRDGELHHNVGSIYERMHRYEQAAAAFTNYLNLLPNRDRSEKALWSRAEIRFLRSFGERQPFALDSDARTTLHTMDFRLINDKVVVRAKVNGIEMDFVVDTGSEQTVISRRTAQRLGISPIVYTLSAGVGEVGLRGLQLGRIDTFEVGTLRIRNIPCLIKNPPLRDLPTRESESFSPLALGLSMTIDYARRRLTIGRALPAEPGEFELPLRLHRLAMVRGLVDDDYAAPFVVDTGGEVISISTDTARALERPAATRKIALKVYGTSGWDRDAFLMPGVNLAFDQIKFNNFPVVVLNLRAPSVLLGFQLGGIVGHKFLSPFRVGIDLERSTLRLWKS